MFTLTTTIALRVLFSSQLGSEQADRLRGAFDVFLRGIYTRAALRLAGRLPTPGNRRYTGAVAYWRGQVSELIDGYRQAGVGPEDRDDLMSRLLAARDEQGQALSAAELADQVAVLMLAGGETTSAAVAWSWHLLCGHPEIRAAVHAEADAVLGRDVAGWEHLPRLDLTARVVREALRLYLPGWVIPRTCTRPASLAGRALPPAPSWSSVPTSCTAAPTCTPSRTVSTLPAGSPRRRNSGRPTSPSAPAPPGASGRSSDSPRPPSSWPPWPPAGT